MKIKTNENKNKTNLPNSITAMTTNQKIGIFFSKQKRTKQLEQENQFLQSKLDEVLQKFQQKNQHLKQIKTKNTALENLLSVFYSENELINQQNSKIQQAISILTSQKQTLTKKQSELTTQMIEIQKTLFENTTKNQQQSNTLQRYQQEIKNEKTLRIAPDSIFNVVTKLEKDLELLERNIVIHENKLQAKKKYLSLVVAKQKKEKIKEEERIKKQTNYNYSKQQLNIYQKNRFPSSSVNLLQQKKKVEFNKNEKDSQIKQNKKLDMKSLNDFIRKKNALMCSNNSK